MNEYPAIIQEDIVIQNYRLINFRNLSEEEVRLVRSMRNSDSIRKWMYNDHIISETEHRNFLKSLGKATNRAYWLVKSENDYIGAINFLNIMWNHRNAYLGIYTNPNRTKRGSGTILLDLILKVAFQFLNLHSLKLEVIENNRAAIGLYKKFGFTIEGYLKEFVYKNDCWKDVVVMGIINPSERDD